MKTYIFNQILTAVEEATEIPRVRILSKEKQPEVAEARSLLFHYLYEMGFTKAQIARMTEHSRQCVTSQVEHFDDRVKYRGKMLSILMQHIDNALKRK